MFEEAIRYPWKGGENVETIAIGGLLSLFGFLLLPAFVVAGYLVRVVRQVSAGNVEEPPVFDDWGELLVDGIKAFVITLSYSLVSFGVVAATALSLILPASFSEGAGASSVNVLGLVFALVVVAVAVLVAVGSAYLTPAAVAAFARTGRVGAAFSPSHLRSIGGHRGYAVAWLVAIAVTILADVASGVVSLTGVGILLVPFLTFYGFVAAAYAIGDGVGDVPVVKNGEENATVGQPAA